LQLQALAQQQGQNNIKIPTYQSLPLNQPQLSPWPSQGSSAQMT
jgi:hypothetical protein